MITATALIMRVTGERTIHCAACEHAVEAELSSVQGVREAKADHETQLIEVNLDTENADFGAIRSALQSILYEVELICGPVPGVSICGAAV